MGGGLMQLVAYGAQDIYLTGNPQITFFKVVYRRHTNFSMEAIQQTFSGTLGLGNKMVATISRNGDLVHKMYCEATLNGTGNAIDNRGAVMLNEVELEIGGQRIDKHYGHWLEAFAELTEPNTAGTVGTQGSSDGTVFQNMACMGGVKANATAGKAFVPLQFWFCRNPGLALPLIALQYHEVKVSILLSSETNSNPSALDLWVDYIYLDTDERRRFAQQSHEYLIEQLQFQNSGDSLNHELNFNHPVKELIWTGGFTESSGVTASIATGTYQLKLNGHDRFAARDYRYFTRTQVWQHHTGCGGIDSDTAATGGQFNDSIGVYSFALKPEEHQPSGTCNFSRIDNAKLVLSTTDALYIYAVNYNVLRVMSGMGGLAYSN
jgi:hypothetical protein